jgi:hypothetical protein
MVWRATDAGLVEEERLAWLERSILLTEKMAPDLYATARSVAQKLGVEAPIELYQGADPGGWASCGHANLQVSRSRSPIRVRIVGPVSSDRTMFAVGFAHELGHYIDLADERVQQAVGTAGQLALRGDDRQARLLSIVAELTADRYALLAVEHLDTVLRAEVAFTSGLGSGVGDDPAGYLDECRRLMEARLETGQLARGTTHPEHALRAYAHWLFSESDVYFEATGHGTQRFPIAEIDARLAKLLGHVEVAAPSVVTAPPPPQQPVDNDTPAPQLTERGVVDRFVDGVKRVFKTEEEPEPVYDDSPIDMSDLGDDLADRFAELEKRERAKKP